VFPASGLLRYSVARMDVYLKLGSGGSGMLTADLDYCAPSPLEL